MKSKIFLIAMLMAASLLVSCEKDDDANIDLPDEQEEEQFTTTFWTAEQVQSIVRNSSNAIPNLTDGGKVIMPGYHNWDYWPLLNMDGTVATVNGYKIMFTLTAPDSVLSGKRHDIVRIRYAISQDNENWQDMGEAFPQDAALGSRQWAGSTYYDAASGKIWMFYTAAGIKGENTDVENGGGGSGSGQAGDDISYDQKIVMTSSTLGSDASTVTFEGWSPHQVILEGDGFIYAEASGKDETGTVFAMRDPYLYKHPQTGNFYILFTGRLAGGPSTYDGAIGIAQAASSDFTQWTLLPPLVGTDINSELERPHVIYHDDNYYLYFSTHMEKFAPPLSNFAPEGLYGFVSKNLGGPYEPLNESGLVAANPLNDPYMTFSWNVLQDNSVLSNVNYYNVPSGINVSQFADLGPEWDKEHFGGTLAPKLLLNVNGNQTSIAGTAAPVLP
jgi:levansucrase